ncbi:hypothetical protein [uncultured Rhodospira sp.]|uniref:hypothetical protein n=1 Tax=uncultured Rhodospira sp. TaxID=1936189 RepID=UPI0026311F0D|nr:hypothetical protein [uncultured Rhodospira sp.]
MTDSLSIGWTRAQADNAYKTHRRLLAVNLVLQSVAAVSVLITPAWLLGILGLTVTAEVEAWARVWAMMVLIVSAFQIPGWLNPVYNRLPHVIGVLARAALAILFLILGGGFVWMALFDGGFAVALYVTYRRLVIAELQTRP